MITAVRIAALHGMLLLPVAPVTAQSRPSTTIDKRNLFLAGWLEEQLTRDTPAALALYEKAAADANRSRRQRVLALARLGEQHWIEGRDKELQATYQSLAGLGIDLGSDRGNPIPSDHIQALAELSARFRQALDGPAGRDREQQLAHLRTELGKALARIRVQSRNPRLSITPNPLLQRVVQYERQPRKPAQDKQLATLYEARLKALQHGDHVAARQLQQQINQRRSQLPPRNIAIHQQMRGKRMAWITELHLRAVSVEETQNAQQRESMIFELPPWQEIAVERRMQHLRLQSTTDEERLRALEIAQLRVEYIADRDAISQWEREVLNELAERLEEHARHDEVLEALELVARLPYRYELLQPRR